MFSKKLSLLLLSVCTSSVCVFAQAEPEPWLILKDANGNNVNVLNSNIVLLDGKITIDGEDGLHVFGFEEVSSFYFDRTLSVTSVNIDLPKVYIDASDNLIVSGNSPLGSIYLYSLAGQLLRHAETSENEFQIPVSGFQKGVYLVKIYGRTVKIIR
ncbi:MAG: T9SS type A sorting domain-containing protein [Dysgonamonadaceae bacterium]|jgi:hypothetical protein|nr:T9SS type A sorting domain-containing protein [Dysgonamonadaceae bacterium]